MQLVGGGFQFNFVSEAVMIEDSDFVPRIIKVRQEAHYSFLVVSWFNQISTCLTMTVKSGSHSMTQVKYRFNFSNDQQTYQLI